MASVGDPGQPSAAAVAIGTAIVSLVVGYYIGQAQSIGVFGTPSRHPSTALAEDGDEFDASDADSERGAAPEVGELQQYAGSNEECKLVLVTRTDLGMTKGKIAAQCSHATLACYKTLKRADPLHPVLRRWEREGQAKVALKVDSEDELLMLQAQAMSLGLCAQIIHDAGRTQIASGSATVLGVGPGPKSVVDQVTGHLKLL